MIQHDGATTIEKFRAIVRATAAPWLAVALLMGAACSSNKTQAPPATAKKKPPAPATYSAIQQRFPEIEERWGVRIQGLRTSAGGYILDFRYRVLDPEKAAPLFVRKTKPILIDQATGRKTVVYSSPKVGPMRTSEPPKKGRVYFINFSNPGAHLKPGAKATVEIGKFRVEDVVVE